MKYMYRVAYKDVKDCFLYVPPNVMKEEVYAKMVHGTTETSYFSLVSGHVKDNDSWNSLVGLNASYAKDLGLVQSELVTVTFIKSLPKLSSVSCIHSSDDLEILELSKDRLEGKILHQIKVVWPGQTFPVWLGKNFCIHIKVESLSPPCSVGILCEGTELDLRPGASVSHVVPQSDSSPPASSESVEFRACQMPSSLEEKVGVNAAVYAKDWPIGWCQTDLWCRITRCNESPSSAVLDTPLVRLDAQQHGDGSVSHAHILIPRHLSRVLGLRGNGHRVQVVPWKPQSPNTIHHPTADPPVDEDIDDSEDNRHQPMWQPLFLGSLISMMEEGVASLELGLRLTPLAKAFNPLSHPRFSHNVLVFGAQGTGRSTVAQEIARRLSGAPHFVHTSTILCKGLVGKRPDACGKILRASLDECFACQPSVLLLDDLDCLACRVKPSEDTTMEGMHSSRIGEVVAGVIWEAVHGRRGHSDQVVVMATALSPGNLSTLLVSGRGAHVFSTALAIPELDSYSREKMLAAMLGCQECDGNDGASWKFLRDISLKTAGFVAVDLADLSERAMFDALRRTASGGRNPDAVGGGQMGRWGVTPEDLDSALLRTSPLSLHGMQLAEGDNRGVSTSPGGEGRLWAGVGGLAGAKRKLEEMVLWPLRYSKLFKSLPLKPRRGLLLYGPPGTGKTHLVSSLVGHCGIRLINVKGPELLSKYIGASEEAVRNIFQKARSARPCVLFFDEFESLAPRRGHDSTGVTDRVVNQLLTQLDGVEEGMADGMAVVAATTRPDLIDPALLRPGRLDTPVLCPMPQEEDRASILRELGSRLVYGDDVVDLPLALARLTSGFTGADLQAVLYTSQVVALKALAQGCQPSGEQCVVVQWKDVLEALKQTKPSLTKAEVEKYERSHAVVSGNPNAAVLAGVMVSHA